MSPRTISIVFTIHGVALAILATLHRGEPWPIPVLHAALAATLFAGAHLVLRIARPHPHPRLHLVQDPERTNEPCPSGERANALRSVPDMSPAGAP